MSDASQAHAQFFSHNAQVRSAIEQALPQLKEAMAEQGISLGQTSVGDQRQQQSFRDTESQAVSSREISESLNLVDVSSEKPPANQQVDGQISTYA
ncbi:flagellar hook-length control protein [compost metagenome]